MIVVRIAVTILCILFAPQSVGHNQLTVTGVDPDSYVNSGLQCWSDATGSVASATLYTVPSDKTFVLTDLIPSVIAGGAITDDGLYLFRYGGASIPLHFVTGIKFAPDSVIAVDADGGTEDDGCLTLSGYLY